MKRWGMMAVIGVVAALCLLPAASSAAELRGGPIIGLNVAFIRGADVINFTGFGSGSNWLLRFGFCGGGFMTVNLSDHVAFEAEVLLSQKGSKEGPTWGGEPTYKYSLKTSYLEFPLLIKFMIPLQRKRSFSLLAITGPAVGIKLSGILKRDSETLAFDGLKSTDLGWVIGFGMYGAGASWDFRYTMGLTKMIEQNGATLDVKNGVISLMIGYAF
jgi:hypothetical protein